MPSKQEVLAMLRCGAIEHQNLSARWHAKENKWSFYAKVLEDVSGDRSLFMNREAFADPQDIRGFQQLAGLALDVARRPADLKPKWHAWLDLLREGQRGFSRDQRSSARDFSFFLRSLEQGTELPSYAYVLLEDGTISGIFRQSAELFEDIVPDLSGTQATETKTDQTDSGTNAAPPAQAKTRGPKRDPERVRKAKAIVSSVSPDGAWRTQKGTGLLMQICEELDASGVASPERWRKNGVCKWEDYHESGVAIKAIDDLVKVHRQKIKTSGIFRNRK